MRIPVTVVTGFLGAGKTTLIDTMLRNTAGRRIALIINEFGDTGVDAALLSECDDAACGKEDIVELANGCICCTVADDFIPTMETLLARTPLPDHIVIETSGLALPQPLLQAFQWPEVKSRISVDGVVAVIDAPAVLEGRFARIILRPLRAKEPPIQIWTMRALYTSWSRTSSLARISSF